MSVLTRSNYIPNTLILSAAVNVDFNQLVDLLSGVSTTKDALIKFSHATDPVLRVDQLGAGVIQQWLQNGTVKARIGNAGDFLFNQSGGFIGDQNGNEYLKFTTTASAVNEVSITNAATGNGPTIAVSGGDTNPNLNINAKGTGRVVIKGYPFTLEVNTTATGNVGTGLDSLHSFSLPANSLAANGDRLIVTYAGTLGANDDNKRIVITFDAQNVEDTGLIDLDGQGWKVTVEYTRLSATSVLATAGIWIGFLQFDSAGANAGTGGRFISRTNTLTVANLTSNAVTLLVQAESATATNDNIVQNLSTVELIQR